MRKYLIPIVLSLLILFGCAQPSAGPPPTAPPTAEETRQIIEVEAVDQIVQYQCQSFWTQDEFLKLSEGDLIAGFKEKYKMDAREFEVSFDEANYSTIIKCSIYGIISKSGNDYRARFEWLLDPLRLNFIDNHFEKSEKALSWEGNIDDTHTIIRLEFPAAIDNCYKHVWWTVP